MTYVAYTPLFQEKNVPIGEKEGKRGREKMRMDGGI